MVDELIAAGRAPNQAATELEAALRDDAFFLTSPSNPADPKHKDDAIEFLQSYARWPETSTCADFAALRLKQGEVHALRSEFERVCELATSDPAPTLAAVATGATPRKGVGGRPPAVDWAVVKAEFLRLMEHHSDFSADDPEWNAIERLYDSLHGFCSARFGREVARTTLQDHVTPWLAEWRASAGN
jgi:hypothetical protein